MSHYDPYEKLRKLEAAYRRGEVPERVYKVLKAKYLREIREIEKYERPVLGEEWEEEEPLFREREVRVSLDSGSTIDELFSDDILDKRIKHALSFLPFVIGSVLAPLSVLSPIFAILPMLVGIYMIRKERSYQRTLGKFLIALTVAAVFFHIILFGPLYFR